MWVSGTDPDVYIDKECGGRMGEVISEISGKYFSWYYRIAKIRNEVLRINYNCPR